MATGKKKTAKVAATSNGKNLTPSQLSALKRKWAKEEKDYWDRQANIIRNKITYLKQQLPAAKKLKIKVKLTSLQLRIKELEKHLKKIETRK